MRYRPFGRTRRQVSEIGFGTWAMGGNMWGATDDRLSQEALRTALDLGITCIDTAYVYGNGHSEQLIGRVLQERGQRDEVFIATKVPPKDYHWPAKADSRAEAIFPGSWIRQTTEQSLQNLRTDHVDLQQLHVWSAAWQDQGDWLDELQKLKKAGKVRHIGISINDHEPDTALEIVRSGAIDSIQVIYNIFDQTPAERLLPLCQEKNCAVIVRVPFDEGGLTGNLTPETKFDKKDWRRFYFKGDRLQEICERAKKLAPLLNGEAKTLPDLALKFCLAHPATSTVIPGMRRPEHVRANAAVSDQRPLSPQTLEKLKAHAWPRNFYPTWEEED